MRLPTKRDYSSRSMASAMRNPVLEQQRDKYVGYQQSFTPMPTNYDDVGTAQARAAVAQGEAGIALAEVGLSVVKAADSAHQIQNKSRLLAKKAEMASWLGGYVADASMRDLALQTGKGKYGYETERANFDKEFRRFEEDLNARYGITDPFIAEEWRAARMGMMDEFGTQLDYLIDGAKDQRAVADAGSALEKVMDHASLDKWAKEVGVFVFAPDKLNDIMDLKTQEIEINSALVTVRDNPASNSNNFLYGEIDTILEREQLKPETREQMIKILQAKMKENEDEARFRILNATNSGEIWEAWLDESGKNNLAASFEVQVRERISQMESKSYISEINRYGEEGNLAMVADEVLYSSQNPDINLNDRANIQAAQQRVVMSAIQNDIRKLMVGESLTSTYLDVDGNVAEAYQGSKVAVRIAEINEEIYASEEGARKYGLSWGNPEFDENAQKFLGALDRIAQANSQRLMNSRAMQDQISEDERYIRTMASDPRQMQLTDWTNYTGDQATTHVNDIYERWLDDQGIRVSEMNFSEMEAYNDYATWFTSLSGYAPTGHVANLTQILMNPGTHKDEEVFQAMAGLTDIWTANPEVLNQKGIEGEGFEQAFEAAWYMKHSGQGVLGLNEFLNSRRTSQLNPEEAKRKVDVAKDGMKEGGDFDNAYAQMQEGNKWMPEVVSDQMRGDIERILETIAPTSHDHRWAYRKAISRAMSMYGVEQRLTVTAPGETEMKSQWVYQSIYRFHNDGAGADRTSQLAGESGFSEWRMRGSQNNLVQMTIDDFAAQHGYDPERISMMYVGAASGPYWMMVDNQTGTPISLKPGTASWEKAEAANPSAHSPHGGVHALIIRPDQLSVRAREHKQLVLNTQQYDAAESAHKEWEKMISVVSDGSIAEQTFSFVKNIFSGPQFQGVDNLPQPSPEERELMSIWDEKVASTEEGTMERAQAKAMTDLLKSDYYRTAVVTGRERGVQRLIDITMSISKSWWEAKQLDTIHKLQTEDVARAIR